MEIIKDTNSKREKIEEVVNYIDERLGELEEEKEAQRQFERKEREKNMTFAELLERHGDSGNKY